MTTALTASLRAKNLACGDHVAAAAAIVGPMMAAAIANKEGVIQYVDHNA